jgi:hypothetical protein
MVIRATGRNDHQALLARRPRLLARNITGIG